MSSTDSKPLPIAAVVAVARNGVIGRDGSLPWRMRADLKWFKKATLGKPIIMGRTTWEDLGRPLPGRINIVVSRRGLDLPEGVHLASSIEEAIKIAHASAAETGADEIGIIGGAQIYRAAMDRIDLIYLTRIEADVEGDTVLDLPPREGWDIETLDVIEADADNQYDATIEKWQRL